MEKSERQFGPEIRSTCFKISNSLKHIYEDVQIQMDLRDNLKLKDKLSYVMNNQNTFLKERASKTIVVGVDEIQQGYVTVKVDGATENYKVSMSELD